MEFGLSFIDVVCLNSYVSIENILFESGVNLCGWYNLYIKDSFN